MARRKSESNEKYTKSLRFVTRLWGPSNTILVGVDGRHGGLLSLAGGSDPRKKLRTLKFLVVGHSQLPNLKAGHRRTEPTEARLQTCRAGKHSVGPNAARQLPWHRYWNCGVPGLSQRSQRPASFRHILAVLRSPQHRGVAHRELCGLSQRYATVRC